ncbi:MAG TPA: hypothetical protein DCW51_08085 [Clostridium sp.]|nr:hypothetical protein [Clostridium sp.]
MDQVFCQYRPDVVFYAAAHKHVPQMEENMADAIKNNIIALYLYSILVKNFNS